MQGKAPSYRTGQRCRRGFLLSETACLARSRSVESSRPRLSGKSEAVTISLRQTVVRYAHRYQIASAAPERNENLKRLIGRQLEQWKRDGADWIQITGSGPSRRLRVDAERFDAALEALPRCIREGCDRPALAEGGACGSCGYGRSGRPREVEWQLQTCAGCGTEQLAPIYGRQRRWWCENCNGRQKYRPHNCDRDGCERLVSGPHRFCSQSCSAYAKWATGTLNLEIIAPAITALKVHHEEAVARVRARHRASRAALKGEGLVPLKEAAPLVGWSPMTLRSGKVGAVVSREYGGLVWFGISARDVKRLSTDPDVRRKLAKPLAALNAEGGTLGHYGAPLKLSEAEVAEVVQLRSGDLKSWGWRRLAARLNERRDSDKHVSHMTVKRAVERADREATAAA